MRNNILPFKFWHHQKRHAMRETAIGTSQTRLSDNKGPIRILIVEDDALIAGEMEAVLEQAGADVVAIASSYDEALERSQQVRPILALIDVELGGPRDGIELAQQLSDCLGIRSIFVTGHSDPKSVARGASAEPLSWIKKPFGPGTIIAAVQLAMKEL